MIRGKFLTSKDDTRAVMAIRHKVFVEEQGYAAEEEVDIYDQMAIYGLVFDLDDRPAGTARLIMTEDNKPTIGRVCVLKEARGQGLGDLLMRMMLYRVVEMQLPEVYVGSQMPVVEFYKRYGLKPVGDIYLDQGQPHQMMRAALEEIDLEGSCGGHMPSPCNFDCSACAQGCTDRQAPVDN